MIVLNGVLDIMVKKSEEKKSFNKGSVIMLPGDLAEREIILELSGDREILAYQAMTKTVVR